MPTAVPLSCRFLPWTSCGYICVVSVLCCIAQASTFENSNFHHVTMRRPTSLGPYRNLYVVIYRMPQSFKISCPRTPLLPPVAPHTWILGRMRRVAQFVSFLVFGREDTAVRPRRLVTFGGDPCLLQLAQ